MVTIVTDVQLKEGSEQDWDAAMRERMEAAKKQPGWVGGQMLEPEDDPRRRVIVGTWETRDDWEKWHEDPEFAETREELEGLVMGASAIPTSEPGHWYQEPIFWGGVIAVVFVVLNIALW